MGTTSHFLPGLSSPHSAHQLHPRAQRHSTFTLGPGTKTLPKDTKDTLAGSEHHTLLHLLLAEVGMAVPLGMLSYPHCFIYPPKEFPWLFSLRVKFSTGKMQQSLTFMVQTL